MKTLVNDPTLFLLVFIGGLLVVERALMLAEWIYRRIRWQLALRRLRHEFVETRTEVQDRLFGGLAAGLYGVDIKEFTDKVDAIVAPLKGTHGNQDAHREVRGAAGD